MAVRIRPASPADAGPLARVHVDSWRTTYDGIVPAEYLASLSYRAWEPRWADILTTDRPATSSFVAETDGGEVVGFAEGGPEREGNRAYRGELYAIYLLEEYQRQRLGVRLVSAVVRRLLVGGFETMLVWVLEENHGACRFYESLGGEQVGQKTIAIGGAELVEVSYGWRDIGTLAPWPAYC